MLRFKHFKRHNTQHDFCGFDISLKANYIFTVCLKVAVYEMIMSVTDFFRYAELLGESKELSLTKKMPRSKIVYLFTMSLFGLFAIGFFMKVRVYSLPKESWMQMQRFIFYMSSFAVKIFQSEHDVCCDCGVQVREADKYCRGSSQEWSALFLCVFVRLDTDHCLALSLNHKGQPSIKTNHRKN